MIVCVLLPRFQLNVAAGDRTELLQTPAALAPEPGGTQQVGEVSLTAEAFGVHPGMRLGEALARCPRLTLVPPDPAGVADFWERLLVRLESIGAAVEPERPGLACFDARGLLRLHGGIEGVLARRASFAASAGSLRRGAVAVCGSRGGDAGARTQAGDRARDDRQQTRAGSGPEQGLVADPVSVMAAAGPMRAPTWLRCRSRLLRARPALAELPEALERLGVKTLGELAALPPAAVADRFGSAGLLARELATGGDVALAPRPAAEFLRESLELPEATSGMQLERGLGLLIDRLLARRERRGRTLRSVVLSAVLVEQGGTWREQVVFREALADPVRMRLVLIPRLALIPAPAEVIRLSVERFRPAGERSTHAARGSRRCPDCTPSRSDPAGSRRRRSRCGTARAGSRSRLSRPRAPGGAGAV